MQHLPITMLLLTAVLWNLKRENKTMKKKRQKKAPFITMAADTYKNRESIFTVVVHSLMRWTSKTGSIWMQWIMDILQLWCSFPGVIQTNQLISHVAIYHLPWLHIHIGRRTMALVTADSNVMQCKYEIWWRKTFYPASKHWRQQQSLGTRYWVNVTVFKF